MTNLFTLINILVTYSHTPHLPHKPQFKIKRWLVSFCDMAICIGWLVWRTNVWNKGASWYNTRCTILNSNHKKYNGIYLLRKYYPQCHQQMVLLLTGHLMVNFSQSKNSNFYLLLRSFVNRSGCCYFWTACQPLDS